MTIATTDNRANHVGDAIIVEFSFTFKVLDEAHIYPYLDAVVQSSGFTVALNADQDASPGGSVTFTAAPGDGVAVTIERIVPNTQGVDYTPYDNFPAETHEEALDVLTMQVQQLADKIDRATVAPVTDDGTADYTLPPAESLKIFRWNEAADALENTDDPAVSAAAALVSETNAAASETAAGISETNAAASAAAAAASSTYKGDATGAVDVITATLGITVLVDNLFVILRASGANATTTPTFAPDGLDAETIVKNGDQALDVGDIPNSDYEMLLKRNDTNTAWELMNPYVGSIGHGQTWQDVIGSRALVTTYYNTTGKPISVSVSGQSTNINGWVALTIDGLIMSYEETGVATLKMNVTGIVPNGSSYSVTARATGSLSHWAELR